MWSIRTPWSPLVFFILREEKQLVRLNAPHGTQRGVAPSLSHSTALEGALAGCAICLERRLVLLGSAAGRVVALDEAAHCPEVLLARALDEQSNQLAHHRDSHLHPHVRFHPGTGRGAAVGFGRRALGLALRQRRRGLEDRVLNFDGNGNATGDGAHLRMARASVDDHVLRVRRDAAQGFGDELGHLERGRRLQCAEDHVRVFG
mmetsp:Transcript_197/g.852  ORF Transcript_197/g.852 Transcript_197/m.852 type:complete len:204 (-) Transcript_197:269-880(-)